MDTRYSRLAACAPLGSTLQRWQAASVAVIGCGGLGGGLITQLARFGVRRMLVVDRDVVGRENLGHQSLFTEEDVRRGLPKAIAAQEMVRRINRDVDVRAEVLSLNRLNIREVLGDAELLFDGLDSYATRFLLNDYALTSNKPFFYAGVAGAELSAQAVVPRMTRCLRCLLPAAPAAGAAASCAAAGLFPPLLGLANLLQIAAANCWLADGSDPAVGRLYSFNLASGRLSQLQCSGPQAQCPACRGDYAYLEGRLGSSPTDSCVPGTAEMQLDLTEVRLPEVEARLKANGGFELASNPWCLSASRGEQRFTVFGSGRILLQGAESAAQLETFAVTYIGI